jgi:hypothetical protein
VDGPDDIALLFLYVTCGAGFGMRISQFTTIPADLFHGPAFGAPSLDLPMEDRRRDGGGVDSRAMECRDVRERQAATAG